MAKKMIKAILFLMIFSQFVFTDDVSDLGNQVPTENPLKAWMMYMVGKRQLVCHGTRNAKQLDSIEKKGLFSVLAIANKDNGVFEGVIDIPDSEDKESFIKNTRLRFTQNSKQQEGLGYVDMQQIFFAPEGSAFGKRGNIGMIVDPDKTYVFNGVYKVPMHRERSKAFKKSKILLSEYLKKLEKARLMQQERPGSKVVLDGLSAEPYYIDENHDQKSELYLAEIPYNTEYIPRSRLIMIQDEKFEVEKVLLGLIGINKELIC